MCAPCRGANARTSGRSWRRDHTRRGSNDCCDARAPFIEAYLVSLRRTLKGIREDEPKDK